MTDDVAILVDEESAEAAIVGEQLAERIKHSTGLGLAVSAWNGADTTGNCILLTTKKANATLGDEGYVLEVTPQGVVILATNGAGLFYGTQTLLQLLPPQVFRPVKAEEVVTWTVPVVRIEDRPRFRWRALMLDVARHFFNKEDVKNFIDLMAQHKFNVLHLHLTDDEGWRIEINRYPKLTQIGAWRKTIQYGLNPKDSDAYGPDGRYGGFYTQADMREIIAYAEARYVVIVPEIEMPGHSGAALAAYPQYSCAGGPYSTDHEYGNQPPFCAGNDATFEFLEGILSEVVNLFPSKYLHVGGDEANKNQWKQCGKCQGRLRQEGLKDESELQSYFIRRIETFLHARDRTLIGWDEIIEGGLAPRATVMSWRGFEGGIAAANAGHDVVMTPVSHCYFDHRQSRTVQPDEPKAYSDASLTMETVYSFDPVPPDLVGNRFHHIIGGGANIWSTLMPNYASVQYMSYPRACAMAEVLWTDLPQKNWDDFRSRLETHQWRLKAQGVNYRQPRPTD